MTAMERIHADHRGSKMCIHTNHIREYQSQSWKSFSSLRTFQDVLFKTGAGCKDTLRRQSISKNYISTSRHQIKNQGTALFPEFINQSAANQSNDPLVPPGILTRNRLLPYRWTNFREKTSPRTSAESLKFHKRARHYQSKLRYLQDCHQNGSIKFHQTSTNDMIADIFTKALPKPAHDKHASTLLSDLPQAIVDMTLSSDSQVAPEDRTVEEERLQASIRRST